MQLAKEIQDFSSVCERLIAEALRSRSLTEDEKRLVEYYCDEVKKIINRSSNDSAKTT